MVDIIGNSFDGLGIIPSSKMIKGGYRTIIGNGSGLFRRSLGFDKGTFANASDRYILVQNPSTGLYEMTGTFGSNILATRNISGDLYGQFEKQYATKNTYSEQLATSLSTLAQATWSSNAANDPLGNATADKLCEDATAASAHSASANFTLGVNTYAMVVFAEADERSQFSLYANVSPAACEEMYDLGLGTVSNISGSPEDSFILELASGLFCCVMIYAEDTGAARAHSIILYKGGLGSYDGSSGEGLNLSFFNIIQADHLTSYIRAVASVVTKAPDVFYFPSAAVPTWMKQKFTMKLIPNYDIPYTTEDKPLWSFDKTESTLTTSNGRYGMAVNDTTLYWANYPSSNIKHMPIGGGSVSTVTASGQTADVALNATDVFFTEQNTGKVRKFPLGGGSITDVVTGLNSPYSIALTATDVYWSTFAASKIQKAPIGGGSVTDVVTGVSSVRGIATDSTYLYYINSTNVYRIPLAGGTSQLVCATGATPLFLAVDDHFIYWCAYGASSVSCASKNGGAVASLVSDAGVTAVAILEKALFWSTDAASSTIKRRDSVSSWLTTSGTVKVVEGPDTKVETSAATASIHQNVEVEFDRMNGKITLSGFTSGNGEYTDTTWTEPSSNFEYCCALNGAAQTDALVSEPVG